jgi:hypothetical protein
MNTRKPLKNSVCIAGFINYLYKFLTCILACFFLSMLNIQSSYSKILLEYYTAQGCVSCQQAGDFVKQINEGKDFISLEFHTDYWDGEGWVDPFSNDKFETRHKKYIEKLSPSFANVPQIVISGTEVSSGLNKKDTVDKLKKAQKRIKALGIELSIIGISDKGVEIDIENPNNIVADFDILFAQYYKNKATRILKGELKGTILDNNNIVTDLIKVKEWKGDGGQQSLKLNIKLKDDEGMAIFLQEKNLGLIVAADNYEQK